MKAIGHHQKGITSMSIKAVSVLGIASALFAFALIIYWMVEGNRADKERRALVHFAACVHLLVEETPADETSNWTPAELVENCFTQAGVRFIRTSPTTRKLEFSGL